MKEQIIQNSILNYLLLDNRVAWAHRMNTGAARYGAKGNERFIRFGFPGCSDIVGQLKDGRILCLEVKRPKGKATELQQSFIDLVNKNNGVAGVVRSIDDAAAIITNAEKRILHV